MLKTKHITDPTGLADTLRDLSRLRDARHRAIPESAELTLLEMQLSDVNASLWIAEDEIRKSIALRHFDDSFVSLAISICRLNDRRASLKSDINRMLQSEVVDLKHYSAAQPT